MPVQPGNAALWRLLTAAGTQWRTRVATVSAPTKDGMAIPVATSQLQGLDIQAVATMAPAFGLEINQSFFEKIHAFETECLRIWQGGEGGCTEKKKEGCKLQFGKYLNWACKKCKGNGTH